MEKTKCDEYGQKPLFKTKPEPGNTMSTGENQEVVLAEFSTLS
jgi:hypothetical protein